MEVLNPIRLFWGVDFPLHKPYIQLQVCSLSAWIHPETSTLEFCIPAFCGILLQPGWKSLICKWKNICHKQFLDFPENTRRFPSKATWNGGSQQKPCEVHPQVHPQTTPCITIGISHLSVQDGCTIDVLWHHPGLEFLWNFSETQGKNVNGVSYFPW